MDKKDEKKSLETKEKNILKIYRSFQNNLDSLKVFIDTLSPITFEKDSKQALSVNTLLKNIFKGLGINTEEIIKDADDPEKKAKVELNKEQLNFLVKELNKLPKLGIAHSRILYQSSFVLLVGYFEYLFADLLKFYYKYYPGNISDKPIHIIINELKTYESIDEAIDYIISKEVETILFDLNFNELIDFFNKTLKISLEDDIINWETIIETRERRHIIVHNNSIVNKKYLSKSKIENLPDKEKLVIGKEVNVSDEYFRIAFNEIYLAGNILVFNCWRQWSKSNTTDCFEELLNTTFESLKLNLNDVANRLSYYTVRLDAKSDEEHDLQLRTRFNYLISLQQLGKKEEFEKELSKLNISSLSPIFKLAYYTLKDDRDKIISTIQHCKLVDEMKLEWVHEWPLFKKIRSDADFLKIVEEEFNK